MSIYDCRKPLLARQYVKAHGHAVGLALYFAHHGE